MTSVLNIKHLPSPSHPRNILCSRSQFSYTGWCACVHREHFPSWWPHLSCSGRWRARSCSKPSPVTHLKHAVRWTKCEYTSIFLLNMIFWWCWLLLKWNWKENLIQRTSQFLFLSSLNHPRSSFKSITSLNWGPVITNSTPKYLEMQAVHSGIHTALPLNFSVLLLTILKEYQNKWKYDISFNNYWREMNIK